MLRALRGLVLDEVRLVDDHAAEAEVAEPADVPVEHLVVDDDDVGEAVDGVAVAVDHGGRAARRPEPGLARPVGLDDVRDDDEQRVGVGRLGGEQRLGGLAQAGLVGEQEGAVARPRRRRRPAPGAASARSPPRRAQRRRARAAPCRTRRRRRRSRRTGTAGRAAPSWPAGAARLAGGAAAEKSGAEERVGELAGDDRLRHDPALGARRARSAPAAPAPPRAAGSRPAAVSMLALERPGRVGDARRPRRAA